ncbi:MAG: FAD-binding protein [Saprospiraceae bacterium]|nr:FAD-binding protein [Saprospiraceae bacterium]
MQHLLHTLAQQLEGDLHTDELLRRLYATDASIYRELPLAVAYPKHKADVQTLVRFAGENGLSLIPRSAGTSLAGQCVGTGIVVDISRYMTKVLEINVEAGWVRLQPGVVRDELNQLLKPHGLFFGPNTSTANRCMLGGMVGNNSCGTTSIVYGSTRDHVLALDVVLSDGSEAQFYRLSKAEFEQKKNGNSLEAQLYRQVAEVLADPENQSEIRREFPKPGIHRRNTGYAIDLLLETEPFTSGSPAFNFCTMLCGSEGTLAFTTEITLHVDPLPEPHDVVVCAHFSSLPECLEAVVAAMQHQPAACELMDKLILDCTKSNREQAKNRFFVEGDPAAVLMIEFRGPSPEAAKEKAQTLVADLQKRGFGYAYPIVHAPKTKQVWELRSAGLGVLSNMPGEAKGVACIEDTAVEVADLPAYIGEFEAMMKQFGQKSVYYAHAGAGELHLRPILNLKKESDREMLYRICEASARLVKKYRGSLSGEHGDGRVRAEFIPLMIGEKNYALLRQIKKTWDPNGIFNPGKITDAPPMNTALRYEANQPDRPFDTVLEFSDGILRAAEKCNGSGDCRKLDFAGGTMCPSYRATRREKDTTRARANALREFLTHSQQPNPFSHSELYDVMDLCLSCKACASECPSNVDMASMKAEFLHQYYRAHGVPFRARVFGHIAGLNRLASAVPALSNFFMKNAITGGLLKRVLGVAPQRSLPPLHRVSLRRWFDRTGKNLPLGGPEKGRVLLFCDEFTNYNDAEIGIKTVQLLTRLGYRVEMPNHPESGRAAISKGLLPRARELAVQNVEIFKNRVSSETPLVGIEPSAILSFRDEYPRLVPEKNREDAKALGENALLIEEFLAREIQRGNISAEQFSREKKHILLHGHCHQKSLSGVEASAFVLSLPENFTVEVIPSGCCGMAGSFGYEKEHYAVSMQVGELVLFPNLRKAPADAEVAAPGTSCRHQILDGTGRVAQHPVELLWEALEV